MFSLQEHVDLRPFNTLNIQARARYFVNIETEAGLQDLIQSDQFKSTQKLILGGGSNIVFANDFDGLVLFNNILGVEVVETEQEIFITAGGGENWHDLVRFTVQSGWYGLENLSLIPGTVGAAPVQNIGAYGVELVDVFCSLEAVCLTTGQIKKFSKADCDFSYRDSIFKKALGRDLLISNVTLKLSKQKKLSLNYKGVEEALAVKGWSDPNAQDISDLICEIRSEKLPDPKRVPNVGSFFKNPIISSDHLKEIQKQQADAVFFPLEDGRVKLSAGWLIETCAWKGKRVGEVGVYPRQALVLVNHGSGSGADILNLAACIKQDVKRAFAVQLQIEPIVVG